MWEVLPAIAFNLKSISTAVTAPRLKKGLASLVINCNFHISRYFWKLSAAHTKIIVCVLFYVNFFDWTQYSLISPFSNEKILKTGVHFRFLRETLKAIN